MTVFFSIFFILTLGVVLLVYFSSGDGEVAGSADFFARGSEIGLSPSEIKTLKETADFLSLDKPNLLFGSIKHIDSAICEISSILEESLYKNPQAVEILENLFKYRRRVELQKKNRNNIVISSREIDINQRVKVSLSPNFPPFNGVVITNSPDSFVVDFSSDSKFQQNITINGPVNIYFWKKNDAGYCFESSVLDKTLGDRWRLSHNSELIRSQKREFVRRDIDIQAYIYKLENISKRNNKPENFLGTVTQLQNISEGGVAFLVSGRITKGCILKMEFQLFNMCVVVCGVVREAGFSEDKQVSKVRMVFIEPDIEALNIIRSYIYGLKKELNSNEIPKSVEIENDLYKNEDIDDADLDTVADVEYLPEDNEVFI